MIEAVTFCFFAALSLLMVGICAYCYSGKGRLSGRDDFGYSCTKGGRERRESLKYDSALSEMFPPVSVDQCRGRSGSISRCFSQYRYFGAFLDALVLGIYDRINDTEYSGTEDVCILLRWSTAGLCQSGIRTMR